jgi:hypothetical protein
VANAIAAAIIGGAFGLVVVLIGGQVNRYLAWRTWERDRAKEAYVDFLERAQDAADLASNIARGHKNETSAEKEYLRLLQRAEIRQDLLAGDAARKLAVALRQAVVDLVLDAGVMIDMGEQLIANEGQFTQTYSRRLREYLAARKAFTEAARRDLERW